MKKIGFSGIRRGINEYVRLGNRSNNVIFLKIEIRADRLREYCSRNAVTYTPALIKIIAKTYDTYPIMNAIFARDMFLRKRIFIPDAVDISIAIEKTYKGETFVTTPVIRDVHSMSVQEIGAHIDSLSALSFDQLPHMKEIFLFYRLPDFLKQIVLRCICLSPHLFKRYFGTVGFSNLGKFGITHFYPVWLTSLVFGVGTIEEEPVISSGEITIAPVLHITMGFNHTVLDGATAGRILRELKNRIENGDFSD